MGKRTRSMNFWTIEQYNQFIQYITDISAHTALQLLFYSGMRFGELLALTLADFDFKDNTINITKSLQHKASGDIVTPPKTDNGIRTITMPETIMQEITRLSGGKDAAILCFERDPAQYHRSLVARWLRKAGYEIAEYGV